MNVSPRIQVFPSSLLPLRCCGLFLFVVSLALGCSGPQNGANAGDDTSTAESGAAPSVRPQIPIPEFSLARLSGGEKSDKDYRGKLVLLNFWALWCAPCVAEMPALERLHTSFKDKGLEVVAISVDSKNSQEELKAFVKKYGLSFDILLDPEISLPPKYGVTGFPETFFVGPDGVLRRFYDPNTKTEGVKVISDRPWDSPSYLEAVEAFVEKELRDSNPS